MPPLSGLINLWCLGTLNKLLSYIIAQIIRYQNTGMMRNIVCITLPKNVKAVLSPCAQVLHNLSAHSGIHFLSLCAQWRGEVGSPGSDCIQGAWDETGDAGDQELLGSSHQAQRDFTTLAFVLQCWDPIQSLARVGTSVLPLGYILSSLNIFS